MRIALPLALLVALVSLVGLLRWTRADGTPAVENALSPSGLADRAPEGPERTESLGSPRPEERAPVADPARSPGETWPDLDPRWRERGEWLIYGRVERDGAPFPACRLRIAGAGADDVRLLTDELGRFRLGELPLAGTWTIEVLSVSPAATVDVRSDPRRAPRAVVVRVGGAKVEGRMYDTRGLPVADEPVVAQILFESGIGPRMETRTDGTGAYRLDGLSAGRVLVRGGSVPPNSRDLELATGEFARGVDLGRSPAFPEVSVTLRLPDGRLHVPPAGSLHLVGGPAGTTTLEPVEGECWRGRVPPGEYEPVSRLALVEDRLALDSGSSAVVLNVRGAVVRVRGAPPRDDSRPYRIVLLTDERTGEVLDRDTVLAGRDAWFAGLAPGRYVVRASESDDAPGTAAVVAGPREVIEVDAPPE